MFSQTVEFAGRVTPPVNQVIGWQPCIRPVCGELGVIAQIKNLPK